MTAEIVRLWAVNERLQTELAAGRQREKSQWGEIVALQQCVQALERQVAYTVPTAASRPPATGRAICRHGGAPRAPGTAPASTRAASVGARARR